MTTIRIHHATAAKAEKAGVQIVTINNSEGEAIAVQASKGKTVATHYDAKAALGFCLLGETLRAEYPILSVRTVGLMSDVFHGETQLEAGTDEVPTLADIQELCDEMGLDPEQEAEGGEEDEDERSGSVVPEGYRAKYAERGNAAHCGDWLAKKLDGAFDVTHEKTTSFSWAAFEMCLRDNGVPIEGKWTKLPMTGQKGWQGRYRMNGRQVLEKYVARAGFLVYQGTNYDVPKGELDYLREKHSKWIAGQEKKEGKAE